mgnify:CR=1 FL=1
MTTIKEFISGTIKSFNKKVLPKVEKVLYKSENAIIKELKAHSPVDTGTYASNWKAKRSRLRFGNSLAGLTITNSTPKYGQFIEGGAEIGEAPWYFPHRNKKGQFRKGTGKLKVADGKVWPGGLNPGHAQTVGGAISIVMGNRKLLDKLTIELSDELVKGFL